jgi:hypothetical protein
LTWLAAAAAIASLGGQPRAEPQAVDLEATARILTEARERTGLRETAASLTDVYGPRLTGSPRFKAAADYVVSRLNAWGVDDPHLEAWGPFGPGWSSDLVSAAVVSPIASPLLVYPKAWTPGTDGNVRAEAVSALIESDGDIEKYRGNLQGKFVLTTNARVPRRFEAMAVPHRYTSDQLLNLKAPGPPASSRHGQAGLSLAGGPDFVRKRMQFFVEEGVAALLEPSAGERGQIVVEDGRVGGPVSPGTYPWPEAVVPQVVLPLDQYNRIAMALARKVPVVLEMNIVNSYHTAEADSFNVIAEIRGGDRSQETVMVGAHLDSWHGGTGATDNAAGVAVVLEAMRILKAAGLKMRRTVRLALWGGSEQGLLGSRAYVARHFFDPVSNQVRPEHAALSAYFNVDGGTGAIRGMYLQGNAAVMATLEPWMEPFRMAGMTTLTTRTKEGSDHMAFDEVGLPAFHFIQDPLDYETWTRHSNADVYDRLQPTDLVQNAVIVASFVYRAANLPDRLARRPFPVQ